MNSSLLPVLFSNLLGQIPVIAVCVVGLVLLAGRRTATPQAATLAMIGFGLLAAMAFLVPLASSVLIMVQTRVDLALGSFSWVFIVLRVVSSLLHTAGIILLLMALLKALRPTTVGVSN